MRRCVLGLSFCLFATALGAKEYAQAMQFSVFQPCAGSAAVCGPMILAQGQIDERAPSRLESLLQTMNHPRMVVFDSPGGNLLAALELGDLIRKWGLDTEVGLSYSHAVGETARFVATDIQCHSACAYAFMGGVSRTLVEGAQFGMHQFYGGTGEQEQAATQLAMAALSQYMKRMGIDRDLLDIASLTSSKEMTVIPRSYAVQHNLDNTSPALSGWELRSLENGEMAVVVSQRKPGSDATTFVGLAKVPSAPKLVAVVVRSAGFIPMRNASIAWNYLPSESGDAALCSGIELCIPLELGQPWEYDPANAQMGAVYTAPVADVVRVVTDEGQFQLDAGFAVAASDLDPSVVLGKVGLVNALLALLKASAASETPP